MSEMITSILVDYAMSKQERDTIQEKIQNWLIEEGYKVSKGEDPKTYFTIIAEHITKMKVSVTQSLDSTDRISVQGIIAINQDKQFRNSVERIKELTLKS